MVLIGKIVTLVLPIPLGILLLSFPVVIVYMLITSPVEPFDFFMIIFGGGFFSLLSSILGLYLIFGVFKDRINGKLDEYNFRNWGFGFCAIVTILIIKFLVKSIFGIDIFDGGIEDINI